MIKPETLDFFGRELDKAKLEIVSYWKDMYEKTQKALDVAVGALKVYANQENWDFEHFYSLETYDIASEALDQIKQITETKE